MLDGLLHASVPYRAVPIGPAQLAQEDGVEGVDLLLGPFYASAHQQRWEAGLKCRDRVSYDRKVHKRHGPDILADVPFEDALPRPH